MKKVSTMAVNETFTTSDLLQASVEKLGILPVEQQHEAVDFIDFLYQKYVQSGSKRQRVLNLNKGEIWMSDDFNAPLPDEFWLGEK
jgi:hypothetical protein